MTDAVLGSGPNGEGRQLWLTNESGTLVKLKGLLSVNRPNLTVDEQEKTSHDSGGVREFFAGLTDPGQFSATILHLPGGADDTLLLEHLLSRQNRPAVIGEPALDGTYQWTRFTMFMTSYEPDDGAVDARSEASFAGRVSGLPNFDGAAPPGFTA